MTDPDNDPMPDQEVIFAPSRVRISDMQAYIGQWAERKGWYDPGLCDQLPKIKGRNIGELLALVTSEVSEALEAAREGQMDTVTDANGKPQGFYSELADCVIRIMDLFHAADRSLAVEIALKMAYNEKRSYRHGGKLA